MKWLIKKLRMTNENDVVSEPLLCINTIVANILLNAYFYVLFWIIYVEVITKYFISL